MPIAVQYFQSFFCGLPSRSLLRRGLPTGFVFVFVWTSNLFYPNPSRLTIRSIKNGCDNLNLFYVISFTSIPRKLCMSHSSVKTYPLGPSLIDLTKVLISFIELLTMIQSSTYVMIIIPFLKYKQGMIVDG
jgi:hypothetical protein